MGAGGEAPPVKSEDVMILIGSSILLITIILQAWSVPTTVNEGEDNQYELKYDLSEGNEFSIEVLEGNVQITVVQPDGNISYSPDVTEKWSWTAESDGVHSFIMLGLEDSKVNYDLSRGIIFAYLLYPIGIGILAFGLVKKFGGKENEPIEAVLED